MNFSEYTKKLKGLGREISLEALKGTRELVEPILPSDFMDGVSVMRDIGYGDHERQRLDVYTAEERGGARPVLLFIHGGGFIGGDKHAEGSPFFSNIGAWAVKNGFAGVCMTYRIAPGHQWPSGIEDIRRVVGWVQSQGAEHGLDPSNLFLMGQSAGGAHAAHYLSHAEVYGNAPHGLKGAILLSAMYDFVTMPSSEKERAYLGEDESLYYERSSLEGLLDTDIPLLVTMAEYDPPAFQAQTLQFLNAWQGKHSDLPWYVHLLGQNHLSVALFLGLVGDLLGPQLKLFIQEHS